jgi:type I restriction enzyme S subunit
MSISGYPEYTESGIPWLGVIPSDWQLLPFFSRFSERKISNKGMKCNNLLSLSYGRIVNKDITTLDGLLPASFETYQIVHKDDIVFRLTDLQNDKRSLRSAIVSEKGIITSAYLAVVVHGFDAAFSSYLFRAYDLMKVFYSMGGGLRQSMKYDDMKWLMIAAPTVNEQTQIARFLDHETAKIDTLIHEQKRLIELLKEKRQALVLSAFSLSDSVETRLANAVNLIYKPVSQKVDETYIPIGLFNRGRGLFHKDPRGIEEMGESDFFWVNDGDLIISGQFAWEGAVALAGEKEQGKVVSHRYPILRGKNGIVTTEYIFALLTTRHGDFLLNENSRGAAGRNKPLNISALLKEKITIPAFSLQNKIVEIVHQERQIKAEASRQKKLLLEHRAALISAAVTGKIDVRDWQPPADESTFDKEMRQAEIKVTA